MIPTTKTRRTLRLLGVTTGSRVYGDLPWPTGDFPQFDANGRLRFVPEYDAAELRRFGFLPGVVEPVFEIRDVSGLEDVTFASFRGR